MNDVLRFIELMNFGTPLISECDEFGSSLMDSISQAERV
jgi:hypothetical protein